MSLCDVCNTIDCKQQWIPNHLPERPEQCGVHIPHGYLPVVDEKPVPKFLGPSESGKRLLGWKIYELLPHWIVKGALQVFDERVEP